MIDHALGRLPPEDFSHVDKYPALRMIEGPAVCERTLSLTTHWRETYDQGPTPRCVGYSVSQERSLSERRTFDADWLYAQCKLRDGYPGDGTYLRVAYDVMRETGHVAVSRGRGRIREDASPAYGVERFEWATTISQIRHAIEAGKAVVVGTNFYARMFTPERRAGLYWLPKGHEHLGRNGGGHAYLLHRVSDRHEAFFTPNTWGQSDRDWHPGEEGWPVTALPYSLMERLLGEDGEAVLVVDRKEITV